MVLAPPVLVNSASWPLPMYSLRAERLLDPERVALAELEAREADPETRGDPMNVNSPVCQN